MNKPLTLAALVSLAPVPGEAKATTKEPSKPGREFDELWGRYWADCPHRYLRHEFLNRTRPKQPVSAEEIYGFTLRRRPGRSFLWVNSRG